MNLDYESWRCTHDMTLFCPPEGCPASYGCARDKGWEPTQPSPFESEAAAYGPCPDGGTCHHECATRELCYRVGACGPLSGVYDDDQWPAALAAADDHLEDVTP